LENQETRIISPLINFQGKFDLIVKEGFQWLGPWKQTFNSWFWTIWLRTVNLKLTS